jgi:hypothetical protein
VGHHLCELQHFLLSSVRSTPRPELAQHGFRDEQLRGQLETARQQVREATAVAVSLRDELAAAQIAQAEPEADAAELRQAKSERKGRGRQSCRPSPSLG